MINMDKCEKDDDGQVIDPLTYEPIHPDKLITFNQHGVTFCFNIDSLSQSVNAIGPINPMNRVELPSIVMTKINTYMERNKVFIRYSDGYRFSISKSDPIGLILLAILRHESKVDRIGLDEILITSPIHISLYDLDLSRQIGDYQVKEMDISMGIMGITAPSTRFKNIYTYASNYHIDWILDFVPEIYWEPFITPKAPRLLDHQLLSVFILNNTERSDTYMITGLSRLLVGASISTIFARATHEKLKERPTSRSIVWTSLFEKLFSRVIDRYNLDPFDSLEYPYYRND